MQILRAKAKDKWEVLTYDFESWIDFPTYPGHARPSQLTLHQPFTPNFELTLLVLGGMEKAPRGKQERHRMDM